MSIDRAGLDVVTVPLRVSMAVVVEFDVKIHTVTLLDYLVFTFALPPLKINVFKLGAPLSITNSTYQKIPSTMNSSYTKAHPRRI